MSIDLHSAGDHATVLLSIYGALLSTLLAGMKWFEFQRDRADLFVTVTGSWILVPPGPPFGNQSLICIKAANRGRRPLTLNAAALISPKGCKSRRKYLMSVDAFTSGQPVRLEEGEAKDFYILEDEIKNTFSIPQSRYVAFVTDKVGRKFYSHGILRRAWKLRRFDVW